MLKPASSFSVLFYYHIGCFSLPLSTTEIYSGYIVFPCTFSKLMFENTFLYKLEKYVIPARCVDENFQ